MRAERVQIATFVVYLTTALALCGCMPAPTGPYDSEELYRIRIASAVPNRGDILIVVDDSPGMTAIRSDLASRLQGPISSFLATTGLDLHIALTNGSATAPPSETPCNPGPFIATRIDTPDDNWATQIATTLECMASVAPPSTAPQQPLAAAFAALDTPGFLRDNSLLTVVE